jgi:hypothetical protein
MNVRTPYLKLLSASTMALLVILVAGYLMSEPASAQRTTEPSDPVLDAVQQVQRSIAGLQVNLDALQSGMDVQLAPLAVNSRWTPATTESGSRLECIVLNVSDVQKTIHVEVKNGAGTTRNEATVDLAPGAANGEVHIVGSGPLHCKFTVIGGTRADIRASSRGVDGQGRVFVIPAE